MGMTMTQKILAARAGREQVSAGELLECNLDLVFGNDITSPVAIDEFYKMGVGKVFDQKKIALVPDHFTPNKDIAAAGLAKKTREFARSMGIVHYFEVGKVGIEHALLPEKGLIVPGSTVIGADSHTCTHGALGAFATGVGSTDMAAGMATGKAWFKVPEAIKIVIQGKKQPYVTGKDVILHLIGILGVDGARYRSLEFTGDIASLTMDDRFTISNMAIEAGAKNGIFPVDAATLEYIAAHGGNTGTTYQADADASYVQEIVIDLEKVPLTVAFPHLPENARTIGEAEALHIPIDQVVIGSCTNGRIDDMRMAAEILKGRSVSGDLRCIIIPATQEIWKQCVDEGLMNIFVDAGAAVSTPTCGPCLGGHMGILAEGEKCVSTTNRNFVGRMGHVKSEIYLASPAVAAATAVNGWLCGPEAL
ncbi:3-isopropylmalate dehydratase large subunit [Oscillospiraceae bacterium MB08-C2-2]|nr:3-isopropylmalate dehydratase large subunit [Oscillospiraceae bacterium MB08-C2-2]